MQSTQWALLLLLVSWSLQVAGSWIQWRHFRDATQDATCRWSDGFLGIGRARKRFSAGAVAMLSVDAELRVRQLRTMTGLSVFARFRHDPSVQGWTLAELETRRAAAPADTAVAKAIRQAIAQIEEVRSRPR